jgi:regulator of RNase E activity RraA
MTVQRHISTARRLSSADIAAWEYVDATGLSDCLGRAQGMDGGIQALNPDWCVLGQARTVRCTVGDNSALHAALNLAVAGDVLVVDAGGFIGAAVWGGLMTAAAQHKGIAGLVVDGAVRDRAEILASGFPCFARATVPTGPHKSFGGEIDGPIACGGVAVHPGDLVVGDGDGITIVPFDRMASTLSAYRDLKAKETQTLARLSDGGSLADIYGVPEVQTIGEV